MKYLQDQILNHINIDILAHSTYSNTQIYQKSEVSKLRWVTLNEALSYIRPYNLNV